MERKKLIILSLLIAIVSPAFAFPYSCPSQGKVLHYTFKNKSIYFDGRQSVGDRGVLHCYDLSQDRMWEIGNPWSSRFPDKEGLPLDSTYIFDFDISTKALGSKQTYIITFNCQRRGDSEGPLWFCNHYNANTDGYYPFGTEANHAIIFEGATEPNGTDKKCQWYRMHATADTYTTIIMLVDRTNGKHTVYVDDTGYYYYIEEGMKSYDRLVLRQLAKGGIGEIAIYNRHLTNSEMDEFYWGKYGTMHLPEPIPIIQDAETGRFEEKLGVRGWTDRYYYQTVLCAILMALSIILNVFFRKGPFAYRGQGWVVMIMLLTFVFLQIIQKHPWGAIHVTEATVLVSYLVVSIGPVGPNFRRGYHSTFIGALLGALGFSGSFFNSFLGSMLTSLSSGPLTRSRTSRNRRGGIEHEEEVTPVFGASLATFVIYAAIAYMIMWTLSGFVMAFMNLFVVIRFICNFWREYE